MKYSLLLNGDKKNWLVVLLGCLTAFDPLTIDMYLPAFSNIQNDLKTSMPLVELSVSLFFIGMAVGQLVYGPLSDKFGRKKPLIAGMILYFFATLGCAFANNIYLFLFFRVAQAFGGCASMVISRAIVRDLFEKKQVAIFLSNMAIVMGIAPIIAPSIGAFINQYFGWRAIFYFLSSANLISILLILFFLPETNKSIQRKLNISTVLKNYLYFLKDRNFIAYLIPDVSIRAGMFAYIAGSPFVFIQLFHLTPKEYGIFFGINGLGLLLAAQINKKLLNFMTPESICRLGIKIAFFASFILFLLTSFVPILIGIYATLFIFIASLNFISPNSISIVLNNQERKAGSASAFYGCFQWSIAFISSFFVSFFHNNTPLPLMNTIFICGLISLIGFHFLVLDNELQQKN
ncbi:multidrug effflux MFS transporter [Pigmentibacter sp. JX0631]|uniref:multidrug effflux MFS transporter n=1 Tax=Pigmentibacter sp. JX0631 TaxID=2976982 RepID=UPI0024687B0E|nr:multidrug effflux MFS transporter [Pigmentibacter sp. JX0631]WGL59817.1 multidrug effflux MFS transporter [Pigmentibacter sp. JX0631]